MAEKIREKIKLVQGDVRPQLVFSVTDESSGDPIDVSAATTVVRVKFRQVGAPTVKATMQCGKLAGKLNADGTINYAIPYDVPGVGGRVFMDWIAGALDTAGDFEAEIEIDFGSGETHTLYDLLKFKVRPQL